MKDFGDCKAKAFNCFKTLSKSASCSLLLLHAWTLDVVGEKPGFVKTTEALRIVWEM